MFAAMDSWVVIIALLASLFVHSLSVEVQSRRSSSSTSKITVMGSVYCDVCSNNTFSKHSYFLPGAKVHLDCKFKATSPRAREEMFISINKTTDKFGVYKMEIPSVDGFSCANGLALESACKASLIGSSYSSCSVPGLKTTTDGMTVKSKKANLCIYGLNALNYRPSKKNTTLCGKHNEEVDAVDVDGLKSSKFFFPFFPPPFGFPFPNMPPFPSFPFPKLPPLWSSFPFPQMPPSLPFPFPPFPPVSSLFPPVASSPPPAGFDLRDPRTWIPSFPPSNSKKKSFPPASPAGVKPQDDHHHP